MRVVRLRFESRLATPAPDVWARVSTMDGVNAELMPIVRMTAPAAHRTRSLEDVPAGEVLFHSWLLLGGVLPIDRHALRLERVYRGLGFDERSTSAMQQVWIHRRRVEPSAEGARVTDELEFAPRLGFTAPLLRPIIRTIFDHRHHRLRAVFGALDGSPPSGD